MEEELITIQVLQQALVGLQFADAYIPVEPYEHGAEKEADGHYALRASIQNLELVLSNLNTKQLGSNFDDFLKEEGILDEVSNVAIERIKDRVRLNTLRDVFYIAHSSHTLSDLTDTLTLAITEMEKDDVDDN